MERKCCMKESKKKQRCPALKLALCATLISAMLCGCSKVNDTPSDGADSAKATGSAQTDTQSPTTEKEPTTLEQELLKLRGIDFDKSDYKKFIGGENIIDEHTEFDCNLNHGYSKTINDIVISDGKIYQANFNSVLANGKNIQEIGTLPGKDVLCWHLTYDGEMGNIYLKDGSVYKASNPPFSTTSLDKTQYPLFKKVYRYAADGKTLEDHTAEYLNADKIYDTGIPMIAFVDNKVSLLFSGKYLDNGTTGWNWYRDMGWREYIAVDLDLSAIGNETPIRLFNKNILMTDCAFYEIVYASEPMDEKNAAAQLAPDGSVSPYYPAAQHLNCNLALRKITLLSNHYSEVRNISTSHVITTDYMMLPITEIVTDGYSKYTQYDCIDFYWDYSKQ